MKDGDAFIAWLQHRVQIELTFRRFGWTPYLLDAAYIDTLLMMSN